jgi:hypothetical protein
MIIILLAPLCVILKQITFRQECLGTLLVAVLVGRPYAK